MAVRVSENNRPMPLTMGVDASNRRVGRHVREFRVYGLSYAPDEGGSVAEILAAPLDPTDEDSVAGATLAIGQEHPYLDGSGELPIARVREHSFRSTGETEGVFTATYYTYYRPVYGATPITNRVDTQQSDTQHSTPVYYEETVGGVTTWRAGSVLRKRGERYRFDRFIVAPSDARMSDEYAAAGKTYVLSEPEGGSYRWLYQTPAITDNPRNSGQKILTRVFWRKDALQALVPTPDQPGMFPVPAIPAFGDIEVARLEASGPVYSVTDDAFLYPDGGDEASLPTIQVVIDLLNDG